MNKKDVKLKKSVARGKRVVVAMSGGVDSSVAAYLLKKEGFDVVGIFLKFWQPPKDRCGKAKENACCNLESLGIARQIAESLDIPFYVIHVEEYFRKEIVDNFISEYEKGLTPNPCVRCNRYIKFGFLWEKARALGADYLSTGHYIRKAGISKSKLQISNKPQNPNDKKFEIKKFDIDWKLEIGNLTFNILRSKDEKKDQTYFLSQIDPSIIPHLLFPLGNMDKKEVRAIARKAKLPVYNKKDSVGICFVPDGDNANFLSNYSKKLGKPGNIVDKEGSILGKHDGLIGYTIGQKIGDSKIAARYCKISNDKLKTDEAKSYKLKAILDVPRLYVIDINTRKNQLVIGEDRDCFSDAMEVKGLNVVNPAFKELAEKNKTIYAQIRGGHKAEKGKMKFENNKVFFKFDKMVRAITPGQTVAFYNNNILLGGAVIKK